MPDHIAIHPIDEIPLIDENEISGLAEAHREFAAAHTRVHLKMSKLFEAWADGLDPATMTVDQALRLFKMIGKSREIVVNCEIRMEQFKIEVARRQGE
ncbi:MAG: hypothetical protein ACLP4V_35025 [Methylocella sp.]